jgi:hypothetical protein
VLLLRHDAADVLSRGLSQARDVALAEVDMDGVRVFHCATLCLPCEPCMQVHTLRLSIPLDLRVRLLVGVLSVC